MTAVAFDATTDGGIFSAASKTYSHTVGTLTHGCLHVGVSLWTNGTTITVTSVTYNGVGATRIAQSPRSANDDRAEIWRLVNPAAGAHNVVVTFSGSSDGESGCKSFQFVDQATPERAAAVTAATTVTSTTPTVSATGAQAGDAVVDTLAWDSAAVAATMVAHSPRTQAWNDSGGAGEGGAGSYMLGPADPQVMDWSLGIARQWATAAQVVANDSAAAATSLVMPHNPLAAMLGR